MTFYVMRPVRYQPLCDANRVHGGPRAHSFLPVRLRDLSLFDM